MTTMTQGKKKAKNNSIWRYLYILVYIILAVSWWLPVYLLILGLNELSVFLLCFGCVLGELGSSNPKCLGSHPPNHYHKSLQLFLRITTKMCCSSGKNDFACAIIVQSRFSSRTSFSASSGLLRHINLTRNYNLAACVQTRESCWKDFHFYLNLCVCEWMWFLFGEACRTVLAARAYERAWVSSSVLSPSLWTPYVFNCAMEMSSDHFAIGKLF